jgi:RNA polymerase sigma factor (sigma-70 family)
MSDTAGSITQFFDAMRAGDAAGAQKLWERFFPRLHGLARKALLGRPQRAADAEDAAQSAFASFFHRARAGAFGDRLDRDDLWSLLGVIAVRKARKLARRESAAKRGGGHVLDEAALAWAEDHAGLDALAASPAGVFDMHCEELLGQLSEEERTIALLRLFGHKNREIADQLGCTERKVERKLNLIRLTWEQALSE